MKAYSSLFLYILSICLASCEKNSVDNRKDILTPKEELLTGTTWVYNEYFTNYNLSSAKVAFKLGKPNNETNLSLNKVRFDKDRTYIEINSSGDTLKGTWHFLNGETQLEVRNSVGVFVSNIIVLNNNNFTWLDAQRNIFARMLPANFKPELTISTNKLIGKKWLYSEYFIDFSSNSAGLAFKIDKPNNLLDLTKNRVSFNADGTVTEIDEHGNSVPGTWKFINIGSDVGVEINNYAGKFQSIFIYLDDSNYIWYEPNVNRYGKMVLAGNDNISAVSARAKLLCANTWIYTEYFSDYSDVSPSALLSFKRDKSTNNALNLSLAKVTFNLDGTYSEINENGATINGTWQFMENETGMKVMNSLGTYVSSIFHLSDTAFIWRDSDRERYGKMAPLGYHQNNSINTSLITGKKWIYYEYFNNYTTDQSKLVYKNERTLNSLDLRSNFVRFYSNGTFDEKNEHGQAISGTWQIINGTQLRTVSSAGTFIANLIRLDEQSLMWHNAASDTYGKMIVED